VCRKNESRLAILSGEKSTVRDVIAIAFFVWLDRKCAEIAGRQCSDFAKGTLGIQQHS
jgi:hypothetical protein